MKDGFIKVAAGDLPVKVADTKFNTEQIKKAVDEADKQRVNVLCLPELCVTGYFCGDLFFSEKLLSASLDALEEIRKFTWGKYPVVVVGLPMLYRSKLYNCAAVVSNGKILGVVTKTNLPNHGSFYEKRQFAAFENITENLTINIGGNEVPFGNNLVFCHDKLQNYTFGVEICEDLWSVTTPSQGLCMAGALMIFNPSASDEAVGKDEYRRMLVNSASARFLCGYVHSCAGYTESTQDSVCAAHHIISENGTIIAENKPFETNHLLVSEVDVNHLATERQKNTSFENSHITGYRYITFSQKVRTTRLTRNVPKNPFVPECETEVYKRAESILQIQSHGLARRIEHTHAKNCVIGVSGGLDSTLALLVAARAMDILGRPRTDILAITMPCFGTTKRTKSNSEKLCDCLGTDFKEINITKAVNQHFEDIGQNAETYDVTFENSQARERTQVLMDYANKTGGLVVGTGDLSELVLGWATYNGDHMSMYGVNASVPKTLIRYIVRYEMQNGSKELADVLADVLDTPVSPELLPVDEKGEMTQKTEDLVGPYELHDFFLYHIVKYGSSPSKVFRLANYVFAGEYSHDVIKHWLKTFVRRFFNQQFKRSCLPDGPKVGSVSMSPRGDWRMPSDASSAVWLDDVEGL